MAGHHGRAYHYSRLRRRQGRWGMLTRNCSAAQSFITSLGRLRRTGGPSSEPRRPVARVVTEGDVTSLLVHNWKPGEDVAELAIKGRELLDAVPQTAESDRRLGAYGTPIHKRCLCRSRDWGCDAEAVEQLQPVDVPGHALQLGGEIGDAEPVGCDGQGEDRREAGLHDEEEHGRRLIVAGLGGSPRSSDGFSAPHR